MEISRRTDYAIRMLLELAQSDGAPVSVRTLVDRQNVPYAFARGIQRDLANAGLVITKRGVTGGMVIARHPREITLLEVVEAMQGPIFSAVCTRDTEWCTVMQGCRVHGVWGHVDVMVREYLGGQDLAGLVPGKESEVR